MENNTTKELYVNFPSEFYSHFVDFFGKEDRDNYVASSELYLNVMTTKRHTERT